MCSVVLFWGIFNYLNWPSFHWAGVYRLNPIVYQKCTVMQSNDVKCVCLELLHWAAVSLSIHLLLFFLQSGLSRCGPSRCGLWLIIR